MPFNRLIDVFCGQFCERIAYVSAVIRDSVVQTVDRVAEFSLLGLDEQVHVLGQEGARPLKNLRGESVADQLVEFIDREAQREVRRRRWHWPDPDLEDLLVSSQV